jgi:prolyl-tRNA synthetase
MDSLAASKRPSVCSLLIRAVRSIRGGPFLLGFLPHSAGRSTLWADSMRMTRLFTKTLKDAPADAESANARYLVRGGFVRQEMAGVYSWLPLGLRVLGKVQQIIRDEMNAEGGQEIFMPALHPKENWIATGRWDSVDVLFKVPSQTKKEYALGPSHEEIVTPLVQQYVKSYKDLPVAVYQIQTKFRDELRAKSGVLRGREFGMKDLYSFHTTQEDLNAYYAKMMEAYLRVYTRCGTSAKVVEASGGDFSDKFSHEFHIETPAGEDTLLVCSSCTFAQNIEVATVKESDPCPKCGQTIRQTKGIEVGNIYDLGTKYSDAFDLETTFEDGTKGKVLMGCYGIGVTRLVGSIVEASHDDRGIIWPKSVAPFAVHLVSLSSKDTGVQERIGDTAQELYDDLTKQGIEVIWDDRADLSPGAKFADADLLGMPLRIVVSEKTLKEDSVEWKTRNSAESKLVKLEDAAEEIVAFVQEA